MTWCPTLSGEFLELATSVMPLRLRRAVVDHGVRKVCAGLGGKGLALSWLAAMQVSALTAGARVVRYYMVAIHAQLGEQIRELRYMELQGKAAIVTGGAVRLGKALAVALAEEGVSLAIHYNSSAGPADETVAELKDVGADAFAIQGDLSQPDQAPLVIEHAVTHLGSVDILINSAAIFEAADLAATTEASWDKHFAINLKAPFFLSQAFAQHVGRERPGHIINIADWRGMRPDTKYLAYSLTKAGVLSMTQALALALAPNIQVNAIAPGAILPPPGRDQAYLDRLAQAVPLERVGSPQEVSKALIYLLRSDFVTGETIFVTGGEHLT
jgi:pteridine reductase